ncbi:uncharacterized protein LODBEIA_P30530 [Lodderomyces beijingensis]|uniref:Protein LOT5 n=1 Tax=Lodderomyces beijingensis TaxID=1775926 RepID=A0ABP0ZL03_9ASCO
MSPSPRLVYEEPNVENTILYFTYQASSPAKFSPSEDDKFIMHGGSPSYTLKIHNNRGLLRDFSSDQVSLFVLSSSLLIWSNLDGLGLELPYQSIYLHALENRTLYLQVQNCKELGSLDSDADSVEIRLVEDEQVLGNTNPLLQRISGGASAIYEAMTVCSAMHADSEEDEEELLQDAHPGGSGSNSGLKAIEIPGSWLSDGEFGPETLLNINGQADDLGDHEDDGGSVAGMSVNIGISSVLGVKRSGEADGGLIQSKRNRVN